jgi:hypothetical protein
VLINSGNRALQEYMEFYDLVYEPIQKRYSSFAAQYYRDKVSLITKRILLLFKSMGAFY